MLLEHMPEQYYDSIKGMNDHKMTKVMDMMKIRLRYLSDIKNHFYLFGSPDYSTELGLKF